MSSQSNNTNNKHRTPPAKKKLKSKKRIIVTEKQKQTIKTRIGQGFNSKMIADMVDLPVSIVKRYYNSNYFKVTDRETCMNCGKQVKNGNVTCSNCKKKGSTISDDGMFSAVENRPSEMASIRIGVGTKGSFGWKSEGKK